MIPEVLAEPGRARRGRAPRRALAGRGVTCAADGAAGGKGSMDPAEGQKLLDYIAEIDKIFWETKAAA